MRKEFVYSALTGLAVAGSIGLTSFAATSNLIIPHIIPASQTPQVQAVNTQTSIPEKEVADAQENIKENIDTPDTDISDEGKTETRDDNTTLPSGSISEATATKIALTANAGTTVKGFETENEDGVAIYNVSLSNGTDIKIDPVKGIILKTEKEGTDANEVKSNKTPDNENNPNDQDTNEK